MNPPVDYSNSNFLLPNSLPSQTTQNVQQNLYTYQNYTHQNVVLHNNVLVLPQQPYYPNLNFYNLPQQSQYLPPRNFQYSPTPPNLPNNRIVAAMHQLIQNSVLQKQEVEIQKQKKRKIGEEFASFSSSSSSSYFSGKKVPIECFKEALSYVDKIEKSSKNTGTNGNLGIKVTKDLQNQAVKLKQYCENIISQYDHDDQNSEFSISSKKQKIEESPFSYHSFNKDVLETNRRLYNDEETSDVIFNYGESQFFAHKAFLANRSSYFKKNFYGPYKRASQQKEEINLTDPIADTFEEILYYIYTGEIKIVEENIIEIYSSAEYLMINQLLSLCENKLRCLLNRETALPFLIKAYERGLVFCNLEMRNEREIDKEASTKEKGKEPVKDEVIEKEKINLQKQLLLYVLGYAEQIFTKENEDVGLIDPELFWTLLQADDLNLPESKVLNLAINWLEKQQFSEDELGKREEYIKKMKECIRLSEFDFPEIVHDLPTRKIWDKNLYSNEELEKFYRDEANISLKPRNRKNCWVTSQTENIFSCKSLGDVEVIVHWRPIIDAIDSEEKSPTFSIGETDWYLRLNIIKDDIKVELILKENNTSKQTVKAEAEMSIINNKNTTETEQYKLEGYLIKGHSMPMHLQNKEMNQFFLEGHLIIQTKIKL